MVWMNEYAPYFLANIGRDGVPLLQAVNWFPFISSKYPYVVLTEHSSTARDYA